MNLKKTEPKPTLASIVKANPVKMSDEEIGRLMRESAGYERIDRNADGSFKETDPKVAARTRTIKPLSLRGADGWDNVIGRLSTAHKGNPTPVAYIFGGGSSTLHIDLRHLNDEFVYGINWTRKWFEPTMLQIMDDLPFRTQIIENKKPLEGTLVTSETLWNRHAKKRGLSCASARFNCRDPHTDHRSFVVPEHPWEPLEHYSNSLGIALQIVSGIGYQRIVLLGFDFGGEHFFGDGKQEGCANHYGLAGDVKPDLHVKLLALSHVLRQRGCKIAQVGPTKLTWAFDQFGNIDEALDHVCT